MIRAALGAGLLALTVMSAQADELHLPALYDVRGVAADDTLNIRQAPSASSTIIGTLAPDATGIEVVAKGPTGSWGRINTGEQSGFVSLAFLTRQPGQPTIMDTPVTQCFGTEPFWGITFRHTGATTGGTWSTPEETRDLSFLIGPRAAGRADRFAITGTGTSLVTKRTLTGVIRAEYCTDGMSDRQYGLAIDLLSLKGGTDRTLFTGCCSIAPLQP